MLVSRQVFQKLQPAATRVVARSLANDVQAKVTVTTPSSSSSFRGRKGPHEDDFHSWAKAFAGFLAASSTAAAGVTLMEPAKNKTTVNDASLKPYSREAPSMVDPNNPPKRPDLPIIPLEEVAEHCDEDSLWYTFRGAVYDLTFFLNGHPGEGFALILPFTTHFPFWFPECLGCSFCCFVLIPLCILLDGRVVVLEFWIQVFASHFVTLLL